DRRAGGKRHWAAARDGKFRAPFASPLSGLANDSATGLLAGAMQQGMGDVVLEVAVRGEASDADRRTAVERFEAVRRETESLAVNLTAEDQSIQSMPDASPTKWHLGHTTWFFETFLLTRFDAACWQFDSACVSLFDSFDYA